MEEEKETNVVYNFLIPKKTILPHINSRHLGVKMVTYSSFTWLNNVILWTSLQLQISFRTHIRVLHVDNLKQIRLHFSYFFPFKIFFTQHPDVFDLYLERAYIVSQNRELLSCNNQQSQCIRYNRWVISGILFVPGRLFPHFKVFNPADICT